MLSGKRNEIHNRDFSLIPLKSVDDFRRDRIILFDCGRSDLNEFFHCDAYDHMGELLAVTYFFQPKKATRNKIFFPVALISLLNDRIEVTYKDRAKDKKNFYRQHIKKTIPKEKRSYQSFPAVKIGRLGVLKDYHGQEVGTILLNMVKELFKKNNRTGCRFITVDAYNDPNTIRFYVDKNGFSFLWDKDKDDSTRILFFDLKPHEG